MYHTPAWVRFSHRAGRIKGNSSMAMVTEIVSGIYRISSGPAKDYAIGFNQFLIADEKPTLIHTGHYEAYDEVRSAIKQVLDPKLLAYVVIRHFEADECGGMDRFLAESPQSILAASELEAAVNLNHWGYKGAAKGMRDGDTLALGTHQVRFLETPHVHHWDLLMCFEEVTNSPAPKHSMAISASPTPDVTTGSAC